MGVKARMDAVAAVAENVPMTPGRGPERPAIRTPDQRLRIFVSSTLRLAPVMFELGARPHQPRDLPSSISG